MLTSLRSKMLLVWEKLQKFLVWKTCLSKFGSSALKSKCQNAVVVKTHQVQQANLTVLVWRAKFGQIVSLWDKGGLEVRQSSSLGCWFFFFCPLILGVGQIYSKGDGEENDLTNCRRQKRCSCSTVVYVCQVQMDVRCRWIEEIPASGSKHNQANNHKHINNKNR